MLHNNTINTECKQIERFLPGHLYGKYVCIYVLERFFFWNWQYFENLSILREKTWVISFTLNVQLEGAINPSTYSLLKCIVITSESIGNFNSNFLIVIEISSRAKFYILICVLYQGYDKLNLRFLSSPRHRKEITNARI